MQLRSIAIGIAALAVACAPARRPPEGDDDGAGGTGGSTGDDDGTGGTGGTGSNCGMVDQPQSTPLALPDTNEGNENPSCTTASSCPAQAPNCVITADTVDTGGPGFCAQSYTDTLNFVGFGSGETLTDPDHQLIAICATMEHSWVGDLQIEIMSPDGKTAALRQFHGREGGDMFLGHANDCDSDDDPVPGVGYKYCWTMSATDTLLTSDNESCGAPSGCESWDDPCDGGAEVVPAGNYQPDVAFDALEGAQLDGDWTFRVTDLWAVDNGFLFDWSIQFDPSLVADCSQPIIQ
jgi:hypothetical protein